MNHPTITITTVVYTTTEHHVTARADRATLRAIIDLEQLVVLPSVAFTGPPAMFPVLLAAVEEHARALTPNP